MRLSLRIGLSYRCSRLPPGSQVAVKCCNTGPQTEVGLRSGSLSDRWPPVPVTRTNDGPVGKSHTVHWINAYRPAVATIDQRGADGHSGDATSDEGHRPGPPSRSGRDLPGRCPDPG